MPKTQGESAEHDIAEATAAGVQFNSYSARTLSPKAVFRKMVALLRRYVRKHGYTMRVNIPYKLRSTGRIVGADSDSQA